MGGEVTDLRWLAIGILVAAGQTFTDRYIAPLASLARFNGAGWRRFTPPIHASRFFRIDAIVVRGTTRPSCFAVAHIAVVPYATVLVAITHRRRRNALVVLAHQALRTGAIFARRATFILADTSRTRTVRQAFMVARTAIAVVVHEVHALGPAPGEAWRAMLILRATGYHERGHQNADVNQAFPRHRRLRVLCGYAKAISEYVLRFEPGRAVALLVAMLGAEAVSADAVHAVGIPAFRNIGAFG